MKLYKRLKDNGLVINEKEYNELIHIRQIKVNHKFVTDPQIKIKDNKKYNVEIGILTKII